VTMKLRIETLKAPWPTGAKVGNVIEIDGDNIPAWALGKCAKVDDETPVTVKAEKPAAKKGE